MPSTSVSVTPFCDLQCCFCGDSPRNLSILDPEHDPLESWEIIGPYRSWWLFNGLLLVLQVLHVIWSYLIARIAFKALIRGKVSKDDRSDVESSSEEEDITTSTKGPCGRSSSNGANRVNGHMGGSYWAEE